MYRRKRHSSVPLPEIVHSGDELEEENDEDDEVIMSSPYQINALVRTPTRPRGPREIGSPSPLDAPEHHRSVSPTPARKKAAQLYDGPVGPRGLTSPGGGGGGPRRVSGQKRGAPPDDEFEESPPSVKKLVFAADDDSATTVRSVASGSASSSASSYSTTNHERPSGTSQTSSLPEESLANGDSRPPIMMQIEAVQDEVRFSACVLGFL
jgi:hypothetical protein